MIVHLRGTNGSGKSTVVRRLLVEHSGKIVETREFMRGSKPERVKLWRCDGDLYVIGSYNLEAVAPGVGGDHINGQFGADVIQHYATCCPHLLWESARGSVERMRDNLRSLGIVWALLDTSPAHCIAGVYERRRRTGRNEGKPLNEKKILENHASIHRRVEEERSRADGVAAVTLNRDHAYDQLRDLFVFGGWRSRDTKRVRWIWTPNNDRDPASGSRVAAE